MYGLIKHCYLEEWSFVKCYVYVCRHSYWLENMMSHKITDIRQYQDEIHGQTPYSSWAKNKSKT